MLFLFSTTMIFVMISYCVSEGEMEGSKVGADIVGVLVAGFRVGVVDGIRVGTFDGVRVGVLDGSLDGILVGQLILGAFEG